MTVNAPSVNGTYSYTLTASRSGCADQVRTGTLTVSNCPAPTSCEYSGSATVSNSSPACNTPVQLTAACSGADCAGVSYSW
ncbi:hypothetical protein, partial [Nibrella saemangeumensis]|uniref:hypothetical protein n=1 Tax=Nibrella saemangeumensis TaxID=1084526 RepID=UPI0031E6602D